MAIIDQVNNWMLDLARPEIFDDGHPDNIVVQTRRSFASLCAVLAEHGSPQPEKLTLYQFQARFDYVRQKLKPQNQ